jgi:hypothetical protein
MHILAVTKWVRCLGLRGLSGLVVDGGPTLLLNVQFVQNLVNYKQSLVQ